VRRTDRGTACTPACLEDDHAHVSLGAPGKCLAPGSTVAVTLDVHRHNPHAIEQRDLADVRARLLADI
jgi:hypothetical protein